MEALPDGVAVVDLGGTVRLANVQLAKLSGYEVGELIGQSVDVLVPEAMRVAHGAHRGCYRTAGMPVRTMGEGLDIRLRRRDGSTVAVDVALSPMRWNGEQLIVASLRDVTAHRDAVTAAREAEHRWSEMAEHVNLLVLTGDLTGRVLYANPYLFEVTGLSREEVIGCDVLECLIPPESVDEVRQVVRELAAGGNVARFENPVLTASGERRVVQWFNTTTHDSEGNLTGIAAIGEDVTDRRRAERHLAAFRDVAEALVVGMSGQQVLDVATAAARRLVDADVAKLVVQDRSDPEQLVVVAADGTAIETMETRFGAEGSLSHVVMQTGATMPVPDLSAVAHTNQPLARAGSFGAGLIIPLAVEDRPIGTFTVAKLLGRPGFTPADHDVIETFASQVSLAAQYQYVFHSERHIAEILQRSLLPVDTPAIAGLDLAASYLPAAEVALVGGDFYDVIEVGPQRWGVLLGDVAGKGVAAATTTALARYTARAAARLGLGPVEVLAQLHDAFMADDVPAGSAADEVPTYCTALFGVLEHLGDHRFTFCFAAGGHPLPVHISPDGGMQRPGRPGTVLGLVPDVSWHEVCLTLHEGDWLVLYTDGLTDLPGAAALDDHQLDVLLRAAVRGTASAALRHLEEDVERRTRGIGRRDDTALLVMQVI